MLYDESSRYSLTTWDAHFKPANATVGKGRSVVGIRWSEHKLREKFLSSGSASVFI